MRHVLAEHVQRGGLAVIERDVPVLDPHVLAAADRRLEFADVAGRENSRHAALQARAAPHSPTLADLQAGALWELYVRPDPGADHDRVGRQLEAAARNPALDALLAVEALELVAGVHGHAVRFEQLL